MTSLDRRNDVSHEEAAVPGEVRRWRAFALLAVAFFMTVVDSSIMNIAAGVGGIKVKRQHPACARGGIEYRHRGRLVGRISGQRPGMPGRVGPSAIARDPDVRSTRDRSRDRMPSGLCGGAREAVR